ncbi:MAG: DUF2142 domain-containing protein [Chloroflexi bacterium]|nr:DUF2142 domain-containing protein [Chloroflexota bacterium]
MPFRLRTFKLSEKHFLTLIVLVYLSLGGLYAIFTPLWQTPDEPAHFNYVRVVAETLTLPVLNVGDYDQAYLEAIKARHFPPEMPVDAIRYEEHQPPLYYWLATPFYWLSAAGGVAMQVRVLRLLGVVLGMGVLILVWASARLLFPQAPWRARVAAAFVAVLPMHIAMMATVNNDPLAELFIALGMFRLLLHLRHPDAPPSSWALTGLVVGLGMLTKAQAYILLPLVAAVWGWQWLQAMWPRTFRGGATLPRRQVWKSGIAALVGALVLPLPWWWRNMSIYGRHDPLGLQNHELVVIGQPRTAAWIASAGWSSYLQRLFTFTFESFWGVFGWLGVFLDSRIYQFLLVLSLLVAVGLLWQARQWRRHSERGSTFQRLGLTLLGLQALSVMAAYIWYNISFVQHQGRYLFPALLPIAIGVSLGLEGVLDAEGSRWGAVTLAGATLLTLAWGLWQGDLPGWLLLFLLLAGVGLALRSRWSHLTSGVLALLLMMLLGIIALWALFGAVVPQLAL